MLNDLGDPQRDKVTFNGFFARYNTNSDLLIDVFVRNGFSVTVQDFHGCIQVMTPERHVIAVDDFKFLSNQFGELPSGVSRPWTLFFDKRCVMWHLEPIGPYTLDARIYVKQD